MTDERIEAIRNQNTTYPPLIECSLIELQAIAVIAITNVDTLLDHITALEARPTPHGDEAVQQALDFLRSEREHEAQALFVSIHTGAGLEHVWTLLDYVAVLADVAAATATMIDGVQYLPLSREWIVDKDDVSAVKVSLAALDALAGQGE